MANRLQTYLACVQATLTAALCLQDFASQTVERHTQPEIEAGTSVETLLHALVIARSEYERVLIEPSINSVRVSLCIKQADDLERMLAHTLTRFLMGRAEAFMILRRRPIEGYDISFLITHRHTAALLKHKIVDFIIQFMKDVDAELNELKLFLNGRARFVAEHYLSHLSE